MAQGPLFCDILTKSFDNLSYFIGLAWFLAGDKLKTILCR